MKGTYIMLLRVLKDIDLKVGCLGSLHIPQGYYLYVGSAMGPWKTAYESRVKRHYQKKKKRFWHIDHLTTHRDIAICFTELVIENRKIECEITVQLRKVFDGQILFKNFGSTDCRCGGHLIYLSGTSNKEILENIEMIRSHAPQDLS
ncbi:GIY-YIG nuclease family protein [[Eubacterium] cellulosolvens]